MTHNFCESCNRVRLTCTGTLYMCLGQDDAADLRAPLRASEGNELLSAAIDEAIGRKPKGHDFVIDRTHQPARRLAPHERHRRLGFTFNDSIVKLLTDHINVGQVMFLRGVVATVLIYLLARQRRALRPIHLLADRWVGLRVVGEVGGTLTFLIGLSHMPIANASAILQALPLAVTMGAAMFLSEPVGWRRWGAILQGLPGC
jgi:hypothetical protein